MPNKSKTAMPVLNWASSWPALPIPSVAQQSVTFNRASGSQNWRTLSLVVEIASTNDRRRNMATRIENYLNWGIGHVWLVDTDCQEIHLFQPGISPIQLSSDEVLHGGTVLSQFRSRVEDLFAKPAWY